MDANLRPDPGKEQDLLRPMIEEAEWRAAAAAGAAHFRGRAADNGHQVVSVDLEQLWSARPALGRIRELALSRMAAPWATLGVVLVNALHYVPPWITTPANIIGDGGSLNLILALVSSTRLGKGTSIKAGRVAVDFHHIPIRIAPLGSGEGMAHQYGHTEFNKESGEWRTVVDHNQVVFVVDEIDTLAAL